jgi:hypothetical protein
MHTTAATMPEGVIEHDGMLWKPKRSSTATAEEFIAARTTFKEITEGSRWNPWVRDDRDVEYTHAIEVMEQWRRAEPGHRMLTTKQLEARWARQDQQRERALTKLKQERERRKALYDEERSAARLALFEQRSRLEHEQNELASYRDGSRFPGMAPNRRQEQMAELEQSIDGRRREIERLAPVVGDPETVIDQNGWLPSERRDAMLIHYRMNRERQVKELRIKVPALAASGERKDRIEAGLKRRRLDDLLAVPPLTADDTCSDCPTPIAQHGWVTPPFEGPCPAWPGWGARLKRVRGMMETFARSAPTDSKPPTPKPEPLAVIPSGLPIGEITKRLQELQEQFPDAEVRRGRANRWELWPREDDAMPG